MAGLHIIHLRRWGWSGGPWPSLSDPRHRKGMETAGTGGDGKEITLMTIPQVLSVLFPLNPEADCPSLLGCLKGPSNLVQPQLTLVTPLYLLPASLLPLHHSFWSGTRPGNCSGLPPYSSAHLRCVSNSHGLCLLNPLSPLTSSLSSLLQPWATQDYSDTVPSLVSVAPSGPVWGLAARSFFVVGGCPLHCRVLAASPASIH